ncbi:MAG: HEAT repeat domain-containing protein [Anaerolineae bacterium]|nr:HEAT repeat domain-containing protein [Anaerolineae bacterium]
MDWEQRLQEALEALNGKDYNKRVTALDVLAELKPLRALPDLLGALREADSTIQAKAARALGEIHDPRVVPDLVEALSSQDGAVIAEAAAALGKIGHPDAVPSLLEVLRAEDMRRLFDQERQHPNCFDDAVALGEFAIEISRLRAAAARALGRIGHPSAVEGLVEAMYDVHITAPNDEAAKALERIGTELASEEVMQWRDLWG